MTDIKKFTDIELLKELAIRNKLAQAPTKTVRTSEHQEFIVGIGNDEIASIILHNDACDILGLEYKS